MTTLVLRHGLSQANNRENYGTPLFGHPDASLMPEGKNQAVEAGIILTDRYDADITNTCVATSFMRRTQQTALAAGFRNLAMYKSLNEVTLNLSIEDIQSIRETRTLPITAMYAAEAVLNDPPSEEIWVTHGLLIAGMCKVLGIYQDADVRIIPSFCEIREFPIGNANQESV